MGAASIAADVNGKPKTLQATLARFVANKAELVPVWRYLHSTQWPGNASYTDQMLATADAMVGRYAQAWQETDRAFKHRQSTSASCPGDLGKGNFQAWLSTHAATVDLVMINEAHTEPMTRALIYQMLPLLRRQGYGILAMEALYNRDIARAIDARGYLLDDEASYFYLREPIEGELLREARRLGFRLVSYESEAMDREAGQAANLAAILKAHANTKVFVIAGHGHVYREDGFMAERLARLYARPFLSINQLGSANGALGNHCPSAKGQAPSASLASMAWRQGGHGADVTVVRTGTYTLKRGTEGDAWLSLGGSRSRHRFSLAPCAPHPESCLVEARYEDEAADAVPADRYLAQEDEGHADLYLHDGRYVISYRDATGTLKTGERVDVHGGNLSRIP